MKPERVQYIRPRDIDNRSTRKQKIIWFLEMLAWEGLYWWPMKALGPDRASNALGWLAKTIAPLLPQNTIVLNNLRLAFPEKSEKERHRIASASWENLGRTAGELPHLPVIDPYKSGRVDVVGSQHLRAVQAEKQGAVFISGHFANWEVMAAAICHYPIDCLITYRALNNPHIDKRVSKIRRDYGVQALAPKSLATRDLMRALRAGRAVALMNDQKFNQGLAIRFFGHDAMTAPGPARLALKYGVPVVPVSTRRTGPARFQVAFHTPFVPENTGRPSHDIKACVERISAFIEQEVRNNPEQWFWQHRRWPKNICPRQNMKREPAG